MSLCLVETELIASCDARMIVLFWGNQGAQHLTTAYQTFVETIAAVDIVFVFDRNATVIADLVQRRDKGGPVDFAVAGDPEAEVVAVYAATITTLGEHF